MHVKLICILAGVVLLAVLAAPAHACSVNLGRGWTSDQGGRGVMEVQAGSAGCPALFMINPEQNVPAAQLAINGAPANGTAVVQGGGVISYAPKVGFRGRDSFTVTGSGGTLRIKGRVVVNVK